ncbi:cyclin [Penicillium herquei]|nr:cyclin [Penicillium herquei]
MDHYMRCNALTCRSQLKDKAVVTTCSHIFCLECADGSGLSHSAIEKRRCPACQTSLSNPDDAVATILNPTEDYKTSVLSGLDPYTIMECAGRALGFWAYQSTQEICYQEFVSKNFTEKYTGLKTETDKAALNASSEISSLRRKVSDLQASQEELKKKNQELVDQYREKSKKLSQMTTLYNLLKARTLHSQMETAAADSVTKALKTPTSRSGLKPSATTPSGSSFAPSVPTISRAPLPRASSSRESVSTLSIPRTSFPVDADGVEQLHPYQKSGSAGSAGSTSSTRSNRVSKTPVKNTSMGPPLWPASWTRNRKWGY